ncbi:MAG: hypothetical protein KatS3mg057_0081 [Herpetosiphonaceae bacterium]|nr:MAG: hypothetical protein KatS3mg057_0081 [Herpetosiphonaceae bacterium]
MEKPWEIDLTLYDDEEELLEGLRRHDRLACTCLLKRFAPRLYRLALQLMADPDEAEDVLQEGFIQACAHIDDFQGKSGLGTWLHRIVLNTALMRLRRKQPAMVELQEQPDEAQTRLAEALVDHTAEPGHELLALELREKIDRALSALPDTLRAAFVLRDIEGLSTKEAAAALGIAEPALKVRLHRARLALRNALEPYIQNIAEEGT